MKILKIEYWNGSTFAEVQLDNGTHLSLKFFRRQLKDVTSQEILSKATAFVAAQSSEANSGGLLLEQATIEQLKMEIARRKLTATDLGLDAAAQEVRL
jgi:hypothetical protein